MEASKRIGGWTNKGMDAPNALVGAWARRGMKEWLNASIMAGPVGGAWLDEDRGVGVSESTGEEPWQPGWTGAQATCSRVWGDGNGHLKGVPGSWRETRNGMRGDMDKGAA